MPSPPVSSRQESSSTTTTEPGVTVTCARDGRSHVVPGAVLADSLAAGTGQCTAVCGHIVLPASLASPPGDGCVLCSETSSAGRRSGRRRGARSLFPSSRTA